MIKTYAELLYGKVNYIESTTLNIGELAKKYSPTTNWYDVTGLDVKVGDVVGFEHGIVVFKRPDAEMDQQKILTQAVQDYMDVTARTRGYDGILSACTYATSSNERFKREGQACVEWRDRVWHTCYAILADVLAGNRSAPTIEELIAELPVLEW